MVSIVCPRCNRRSYHPEDIEEGYCSYCHDWTGKDNIVYITEARTSRLALKHMWWRNPNKIALITLLAVACLVIAVIWFTQHPVVAE